MAKYRKIDPRIWNDEKFCKLSDRGKLAFLFMLTHPAMTAVGAMRGTIPGLASELGWSTEAFREAFMEASSKGMAEHDEKACCIAIPKFLKYNLPESPNVVKAWVSSMDLIPECRLKVIVLKRAEAVAKGLKEAFAEAFTEAFAKAMPNQEQEQEQEYQEPITPLSIPPADPSAPKAKKPKAQPSTPPRPTDVTEQTWADWLALRRAKKAPPTTTVLNSARAEAAKAGMTLERFLIAWCASGYHGFKADWLKPNDRGNGNGQNQQHRESAAERTARKAAAFIERLDAAEAIDGECARIPNRVQALDPDG